jgi:serine/threonine protein kinase
MKKSRKLIRRKNKKTKKNKIRKRKGGGKLYDFDGRIKNIELSNKGAEVFRKMTKNKAELKISKMLLEKPHKNIAKIYSVGKDYVDMELLNTDVSTIPIRELKETMREVKTFLQSIGIIYIDWKPDNTGISVDGNLKLFDFDVSGLIDTQTNEWIIEPRPLYSYSQAIEHGMKTPKEIDDYSFEIGFE